MSEIEVSEDTSLSPAEKETTIRWSKVEDRLTIHTEKATVVSWLYEHPDYRERDRRVRDGAVRATTGTLPVGALKLSGKPRKSDQTNQVLGKIPGDGDA